jgi:alpha-galactosidase
MVEDLRRVVPYFYGDYYPLTPYSLENNVWMGWQFDRPDLGEGMVQVFRRAESFYESARFPLRGLEPGAQYVISNLDTGKTQELTGRELAEAGLLVVAEKRPSAVVVVYKKKSGLRQNK